MKFNSILIFSFLALMLYSCGNKTVSSNETEDHLTVTGVPSGFIDFYDEFHSDTTFQLNHIIFPLKGSFIRTDSTGIQKEDKIYDRETWAFHRSFVKDGSYNQSYQLLGDLLIEKISDNLGLLEIERRWAPMDSTWYLIYYGTIQKQW